MNTAGSFTFSSDRTIREYAKDIWDIAPSPVLHESNHADNNFASARIQPSSSLIVANWEHFLQGFQGTFKDWGKQ